VLEEWSSVGADYVCRSGDSLLSTAGITTARADLPTARFEIESETMVRVPPRCLEATHSGRGLALPPARGVLRATPDCAAYLETPTATGIVALTAVWMSSATAAGFET
jgi:hypothetical protein